MTPIHTLKFFKKIPTQNMLKPVHNHNVTPIFHDLEKILMLYVGKTAKELHQAAIF
jgi:hypothetical protein